ncbi:ArnT family glycosyltransferase, partial [Thermodesulfobacteriota bacterium]
VYGILGAVLFLSVPVIIKLSTTVYVDLGEIFFSFASLLLILEWLNSNFKIKYLLYSGVMCGLALGTKYNGLIALFILALFVPFIYSRNNKDKKHLFIKSSVNCIIFIFISLLVFSPWMIRNYNWKGNPIYPLYDEVFNPPKHSISNKAESNQENNVAKQNSGFFTYRSMIYKESGWDIALLPVRIFFQGKDGDPQYFDGKLNPLLFIFSFFAFYRLRNDPEEIRREKKIMLVFTLLFFSFAFFTAVLRVRYISPIIPPLIMLSVLGYKNIYEFISTLKSHIRVQLGKAFIVICLVFFLSLNGTYIYNLYKTVDPVSYISGKVSREKYISGFIPEYPALKYINTNLPVDSKIYFIFLGKRGYYCDREYLFGMGIMSDLIKRAGDPEDILKGFHKRRITHLLVGYNLFDRWVKDNFTEEKQKLARDFFRKHTNLLFSDNGFGVNMLIVENMNVIE